jgi:hypothetical protein
MNIGKTPILLALCIPLLGGCAHGNPAKPATPVAGSEQPAAPGPSFGQVIHVNREEQYVILECTALPSTGEVIKVYRNEEAVGRLRVTGPAYNVFVACDAVDGDVRQGDKVRR